MQERFVGFYWTRPSFWSRVRPDFADVIDAERRSRTIRYQRARAREYVSQGNGKLVEEFAFLETSPDRGTEAIVAQLEKAIEYSRSHRAVLLYVAFAENDGWRSHHVLDPIVEKYAELCCPLEPTRIKLNGEWFDPASHFRWWESEKSQQLSSRRRATLTSFVDMVRRFGGKRGSYQLISDELNKAGIGTVRGDKWTGENVRKMLSRNPDIMSQMPTDVLLTSGALNKLVGASNVVFVEDSVHN